MGALNVLCAQLTRDLFAIAKLLFVNSNNIGSLPVEWDITHFQDV